jgi:hypothetical protein
MHWLILGGAAFIWWMMVVYTKSELSAKLKAALPPRLGRWSDALASAAIATHPDAYDSFEWGKILAGVMDRESNGENVIGFDGHGMGLMQIDDRYHAFASGPDALNPAANVMEGAKILRYYYDQAKGDLRRGIAAYNTGASAFASADPDSTTTGGNYSLDVLNRVATYGV